MTLWPRLETGKSSDTPCSSPSIAAWKYEIGNVLRRRAPRAVAAGVEPREDEAGETDEQRRDAVLHVVVRRPGLMSREEGRQRLCRLSPVDSRNRDQDDPDHDRQHDEKLLLADHRPESYGFGLLARRGMRRIGELAELSRQQVGGLLADVHRPIADALDRARDHHHAEAPLTMRRIGHHVDETLDETAVRPVDRLIQLH